MKKTEHKVESFEIVGKIELLVGFDVTTDKFPLMQEEFHGIHTIDEACVDIELTNAEIVISGKGIDILPLLSKKQKQDLIDNLPI